MRNELLTALINKNVVRENTIVTIVRSGFDMGGSKVLCKEIVEVLQAGIDEENRSYLNVVSTSDVKKFKVRAHHVIEIDGMDPGRIARVYGLKEDGTDRPRGKKRGRKSKASLLENNLNEQNYTFQ